MEGTRISSSERAVPFVDTTIVPDRNAGIGSLLWDLRSPHDPEGDGSPLLARKFAFIDVGVSRAKVATALRTLLATDLKMDVVYVATERPGAVPYAYVALLGERAERIRGCLSGMISSREASREVTDWHCVVDHSGKVSSVAYSYPLHGNEVWEAYFMGRPFLMSGEKVDFLHQTLEEMLAPEVPVIEARMDLQRKRDRDPGQPAPSWEGYRLERNPLEAGLAACGITLQRTDVPQRIEGRQNVLFVGNVLNHYPHGERARALDRMAANMEERDIIVVQMDDAETSSIEVLQVKGQGARKTRERVRWINTRTLEVQQSDGSPGSWRQIRVKPGLAPLVSGVVDCLARKVSSPEWRQEGHQALVRQQLSQVFTSFFRALPVEETLRPALREALRRCPSAGGPKGTPVFQDDATDAYGGPLAADPSPLVSEADLLHLGVSNPHCPDRWQRGFSEEGRHERASRQRGRTASIEGKDFR